MTAQPKMLTGSSTQTWCSLYVIVGILSLAFVLLLIAALVVDFIAPPPCTGRRDAGVPRGKRRA